MFQEDKGGDCSGLQSLQNSVDQNMSYPKLFFGVEIIWFVHVIIFLQIPIEIEMIHFFIYTKYMQH